MHLDVPAYVQHIDHVQNHVRVQAGTNWDLTRTARTTPIVWIDPSKEGAEEKGPSEEPPAESPVTEEAQAQEAPAYDARVPASAPLHVVSFSHEGITLLRDQRKALLRLPKHQPLVVVGYGDSSESDANRLSRIRAKVVTTFLRDHGYTVSEVQALGDTRFDASEGSNRVVEVYAEEGAEKE